MSKKKYYAIGLMSGTSFDGIDVAAIETDGQQVYSRDNLFQTLSYSKSFIEELKSLSCNSSKFNIQKTSESLTYKHADAVNQFLKNSRYKDKINIIGFHGNTIFHDPSKGITLQIGDGPLLAKLLGKDVVYDFRSEDIKLGGNGAPLAPIYHKAVIPEKYWPTAVVNIGGIANITYISSSGNLKAFDISPGNSLIDDFIFENTGLLYDNEGQIASTGKVSIEVLEGLFAHEFFNTKPPKSLDRNSFANKKFLYKDLSLPDGLATLTDFTAQAIAKSVLHFEEKPKTWFCSGGGVNNIYMMSLLSKYIGEKVLSMESIGLSSSLLEAELIAFLAVRSVLGKDISFPETTGVSKNTVGGVFCSC